MLKRALLAITFILTVLGASAADPAQGPGYYATQLQSVTVPALVLEKSKPPNTLLPDAHLYVVVSCNGTAVWRSPTQPVSGSGRTRFEWPDELSSKTAFPWDGESTVTLQVCLSKKGAAAVEGGLWGGGVGAAAGAGIGALAAGLVTGGLGAPVGAVIGAAVGVALGGAGGAVTVGIAAGDTTVFTIECPRNGKFPLDGKLEHSTNELGEVHTAGVEFRFDGAAPEAEQGSLEVGKRYMVGIGAIHLSQAAALKGEADTTTARYYIVLRQGKQDYPFLEETPFEIPAGGSLKTSIVSLFKNTGEATRISIYESDAMGDDLVFTSRVNTVDGKSWAFIGKALADDPQDTSYVEIRTYGPLK